jgi:hypothetical protein
LVDSLSFSFYLPFDPFEVFVNAGGIELKCVEQKSREQADR